MVSKKKSIGVAIGGMVERSVGDSFKRVGKEAEKFNKTLRRSAVGKKAAEDLLKYQKRLDMLNRSQKAGREHTAAFAKALKDTERGFEQAKRKAAQYGVTLKNVTDRNAQFERSSVNAARGLARMERQQRLLSGGRRVARAGAYGAGAGVAAGGALFGASGGLSFARQSARLGTLLGPEDLAKARAAAQEYTLSPGGSARTPTEMLGIQYALNSAGMSPAEARGGSGTVARLAKVTDGAVEDVGEVIATVFNNMGRQFEGTAQQKLDRIGDLMAKTQFKYQFRNFGQLGESLKEGSATLSGYNIPLPQGLALLGSLNTAGLQGGRAGTALGGMVRNLSKASDEIGFDVLTDGKGQLDVIETLRMLGEAIGGFGNIDTETMDQLQQVFGEEGVRGAVLLGKQLDTLRNDLIDVTQNSVGLAKKADAAMLADPTGKIDKAMAGIAAIGNTYVDKVLPSLGGGADSVTDWARRIVTPEAGVFDSTTDAAGRPKGFIDRQVEITNSAVWTPLKNLLDSMTGGGQAAVPGAGGGVVVKGGDFIFNIQPTPGASAAETAEQMRRQFEDMMREYEQRYGVDVNGH